MPDFLTRLAERALGQLPLAQPRVLPRYADPAAKDLPGSTVDREDEIPLLSELAESRGDTSPVPPSSTEATEEQLLAQVDGAIFGHLGLTRAPAAITRQAEAPPSPEPDRTDTDDHPAAEAPDTAEPSSRRPDPPEPSMSLDEYLESRRQGHS